MQIYEMGKARKAFRSEEQHNTVQFDCISVMSVVVEKSDKRDVAGAYISVIS